MNEGKNDFYNELDFRSVDKSVWRPETRAQKFRVSSETNDLAGTIKKMPEHRESVNEKQKRRNNVEKDKKKDFYFR